MLCDTRVTSLLVEGGAIVGVRADAAGGGRPGEHPPADGAGEELRAPIVIVACDPRVAIVEWLGAAPSGAEQFVDSWRQRPRYDGYESKIDAVITELPRYRELDDRLLRAVGVDEPLAPTCYVSPTVDGIAAAHRLGVGGEVADQPIFLANLPSVVDPSMRPDPASHVFSLEVLFTPYARNGGWTVLDEPQRWLDTYATLVEDGFAASLRDWRAMTPDRYEREFFLPRGYAQSFAGGPLAALLGRDPELTRYQTPIAGLFLTGAATFPGAGVWGAPGRNAAQVVLNHRQAAGGMPGR